MAASSAGFMEDWSLGQRHSAIDRSSSIHAVPKMKEILDDRIKRMDALYIGNHAVRRNGVTNKDVGEHG
jgi:hypothetical protein